MGPNGAVTLNLLAIDKVFEWLKVHVDDRLELYDKIQTIAQSAIEAANREAERKRKQAEAEAKRKR